MPPKSKTVDVACPQCGHVQAEPPSAYSTICKKCHQHYRLEEALRPKPKAAPVQVVRKLVRCFQCGSELEVPLSAESSMCKRCSSHVDLADYSINQTVSKNFRTHGRLAIEEKGYALNTNSIAGEAVIRGRLIGAITTERTMEIHTSAMIKGTIKPGCLVIPAGNHFRWPEPIQAGGAEVSGELAATIVSTGTVRLRHTARFFGDIQAGHLVVEEGAVFVGSAKIGAAASHA